VRAPLPVAFRHTVAAVACLVALATAAPAVAQNLQVDLSIPVEAGKRAKVRFGALVESGPATLRGVARNLKGGEAVQVDLLFDYRIPRDTIGLDELIERIEVETRFPDGSVFNAAVIDTQLVPLNPNRVPLAYRVTLYVPPDTPSYVLGVRVFGNYE
jgi:hypothetical protein